MPLIALSLSMLKSYEVCDFLYLSMPFRDAKISAAGKTTVSLSPKTYTFFICYLDIFSDDQITDKLSSNQWDP